MKKRILIFSLAYFPKVGGAEIAVKEITRRIENIEFDMISLRFNKKDSSEERIGNVNVYRIGGSKSLYPFKAFRLASRLHKAKQYQATWAIMANWSGFAALFFKMKFPQVPYVLTLQEGDPISYIKRKVWFVYPLFKKIFTKADKVQAISHYLANWGKDMGYKGEVEVIPNGVSIHRFAEPNFPAHGHKGDLSVPVQEAGSRENLVRLITTSRLVQKNAVGDIIKSLKFLPENVSLDILGIGPLEEILKSKVRSLKLEGRVEFLGHVSYEDIPKHLHEADIFVRPSLSEGMGNSFIEAMAAGLPVVATPVGGIVDFLKDEETGLFCEVNDPESIARAVKRLTSPGCEPFREKIVKNALEMVKEKYDWDIIARDMKEKVFNKVAQ